MIYTSAVAYKFAIFLYKNNHLSDFSIPKNEARNLYLHSFKKEVKTNLNFSTVFFHTLSLLKKQPNHSVLVYKQIKLLNLLSREKDLDAGFNFKKITSPVKVISHSFSFHNNNNNNKKDDDNLISQQECKLCDVKFGNSDKFEEHLSQEQHKFFAGLNKALLATKQQSDLHFTIDDSITLDGIILRKNIEKTVHLKIKNNTKSPITISKIQTNERIKDVVFTPTCPCKFPSLTVIQFVIKVMRKNEGVLNYPILFEIDEINRKHQQYAVELVFHTHNEFFDDLHPEEPYKRATKPVIKDLIENVDSGERPDIFPQPKWQISLPQYRLPIDVAVVLNSGLKPFSEMSRRQQDQLNYMKSLLPETKSSCYLTPENYTNLLDLLLYIEEHQMSKDIRDYDQEDQVLVKVGNLLQLEVPGLAEHRPSVILADPVYVREAKQSRTLYEGFVHKVNESSVLLKFSHSFTSRVFVKNKKFYVHFSFNRYPLRVEHQAVQFVEKHNVAKIFFPERVESKELPFDKTVFSWFNRDIGNNPEQQKAIRSIINKSAMPSPYLIFGPPGTGKTMTVVEAVKQIHKLTNEKVLICAPSNNAANEVTRRLITSVPTTDLHRYIAPSYPHHLIPESIKKYINYRGGAYYLPSVEEIVKFRIVVTTLTSAAKLVNMGCPPGHFNYVFIDEAGQATETETLIAISGILSKRDESITGQIVLAGDPRQLGPIIHSTLAKQYGFGTSMLERLMDTNDLYKKSAGSYNPNALTKLVKNYRSHSVIINQPNALFYDKELQTAGDNLINVAIGWEHLPNPKFPMILHCVIGADQREKTSPSFFNIQEVQVVVGYLEKLIGTRLQGMNIKEEHIGVVTPYKKQAEKIRNACKKMKYNNDRLTIGTVEQFQGQERLIIIVSTVRSKSNMLKFDQKFHLGFLDNPKRFNVAITRAKALLIVVGNPILLQLDKHWKSLIDYCQKNNATTGDRFNFSQNGPEEHLPIAAISETEIVQESPSFSRGIH